jgi:hypothetical protein
MTSQPQQKADGLRTRKAILRQSARKLFAVGMLLLGIAVVCWGLHDKLSLYTPPGVTPPAAQAKLLTEQERATAPQVVAAPVPPRPLAPLMLILFTTLITWLVFRSPAFFRQQPGRVRSNAPSCLRSIRRRPPPSIQLAA